MKNQFSYYSLLLLLMLTVLSCKESDKAPAPDLASKVSGRYVYSELAFDGRTIPADESDLKGDIRITKKTENTIDAVLNIRFKSTNAEFMAYSVSDIELMENASAIDLIYEGETVAQIKGKKIIVNGTDSAGVSFTITCTL
jgi:hypothetical protein